METTAVMVREAEAVSTRIGVNELLESFLSGRNQNTTRAYGRCLETFSKFLGAPTREAGMSFFISLTGGEANGRVLAFRNHLAESKSSPAKINQHLSAIAQVVKLGRMLGVIGWAVEVKRVQNETLRDTSGPGQDAFGRMLGVAADQRDREKAARDIAILRLLFDLGLRRGSVAALDLADLDLVSGTVWITAKRRTNKEKRSLPDETRAALGAWLQVRGNYPGALFVNYDRAGKGERLTGTSVNRLVQHLGRKIGISTRAHGLRHSAITTVLDMTNGDVRAAQKFSGHKNLNTLMVYDDNRRDIGGDLARQLAARVPTPRIGGAA